MLEDLAGRWEGEGKTHEDVPFHGTLELEPLAGGRGLAVAFKAVGVDGTVLCRHRGILAGGRLAFLDDTVGEMKILDRREGHVYGSSEPGGDESYRLEVSFLVGEAGRMEFLISGGLPGQPFVTRVRADLTRA
jgi:hypothetical protein